MELDIVVVVGFDEDSEKALRNAFKAADRLRREHGIEAYVVPINTWIVDPIKSHAASIPRIVVRGRVIASKKVPSPEEIVNHVMEILEKGGGVEELTVPAATFRDPEQSDAVALY